MAIRGGFTNSAEPTEYFVWAHGDTDVTITSEAAMLYGYSVTLTLAGDFALRDGTSNTDPLIVTSANNAATGVNVSMPGVKCDSGIFIDDNASAGTIVVYYRLQ